MNTILAQNLVKIAKSGLISANKSNPFWSKAQAMAAINGARALQQNQPESLVAMSVPYCNELPFGE